MSTIILIDSRECIQFQINKDAQAVKFARNESIDNFKDNPWIKEVQQDQQENQRISLKQTQAGSKKYKVYRREYFKPKTKLAELKSMIKNTSKYIVHKRIENLRKNHFAVQKKS